MNISYAVVQVSAMYARIAKPAPVKFFHTHTHTQTHIHTTKWLELRENSSFTFAGNSTFSTHFCQIYYYITFISSNKQTSQCIMDLFKYLNILHQIQDIQI